MPELRMRFSGRYRVEVGTSEMAKKPYVVAA